MGATQDPGAIRIDFGKGIKLALLMIVLLVSVWGVANQRETRKVLEKLDSIEKKLESPSKESSK